MKIPRDLKPGTRLWYSKTEYATVSIGTYTKVSYQPANDFHVAGVMAVAGTREMRYRLCDGVEVARDTPPIIRIERITSAKPKVGRRECIFDSTVKPKADVDAKWLRDRACAIANTYGCPSYVVKRLRAIARRLENTISGKCVRCDAQVGHPEGYEDQPAVDDAMVANVISVLFALRRHGYRDEADLLQKYSGSLRANLAQAEHQRDAWKAAKEMADEKLNAEQAKGNWQGQHELEMTRVRERNLLAERDSLAARARAESDALRAERDALKARKD